MTLDEHLAEAGRRAGGPDADLARVLHGVSRAARSLAREVRRAALDSLVGLAGKRNVTGDAQKKLDVVGNEAVVSAVADTGLVAAVVSEELPEAMLLAGEGPYVLCVDPLDGSSNTDVNGTVGTIFGVYRREAAGPLTPEELLRPGTEQVLAGYVMYGPGTILVYTAGQGTHGFTLDLDRDAFLLSHPSIRCPARGPYYSANLARVPDWAPGVQRFVTSLTAPAAGVAPGVPKPRTWSLRYTGALVADLHRSLIEGGIYFYPADRANVQGKLRLLYECAPLAFVVEQAGGAASTGTARVLDVRPSSIHQRLPFAIGSAEDVRLYERYAGGIEGS